MASHTHILYLCLENKGVSTTEFWAGHLSALQCLQESIRSYNELPLAGSVFCISSLMSLDSFPIFHGIPGRDKDSGSRGQLSFCLTTSGH